jgi:protein SCO1/2
VSVPVKALSRVLGTAVSVVAVLLVRGVAMAQGLDDHSAHQSHDANGAAPEGLPGISRSLSYYTVPNLKLVRDDGREVTLASELNDGRPVVLNFIYTTCPGICPLSSHVFSQLQRELGAERDHVHLVSISIDPEEDTPSRLRAYAKKYSAGPSWQYYTGTVAASLAAQRAFDVYRGDKMGHTPVTLLRTAPGAPWVRFDGFATADMLLKELHGQSQVAAAAASPRQ